VFQVRAGECLNHVLRHHRHSQHLGLTLPWRPLYDLLQQLYDNPPPQSRGERAAGQEWAVSRLWSVVRRKQLLLP